MLMVFGLVVWIAFAWHERVTDRISLAQLRNAAMTYEHPAGTTVMTQLPSDTFDSWGRSIGERYAASNRIWQRAQRQLIRQLRTLPGSSGTVFLHERVSPGGNLRVVAVNLSPTWTPYGTRVRADLRLFDPGTIWSPALDDVPVTPHADTPTAGTIGGFPGVLCELAVVPWGSDFRLFAGQPDTQDRSRFTIEFKYEGIRGKLVGRLHDDDSIELKSDDGQTIPINFGKIKDK